MEVVHLDGKEYVKASVLAARFKYTADYLGQLCRGRKVDARLIGRAWYVNVDSLNTHKDTRYKPTSKTDIPINDVSITPKEPNHYLSRIDVEPILKKKTVSIYQANKKGGFDEVKVKYENDDYSLIPRVNKEAISQRMAIDPAEAEEVKIKKEGSVGTRFKAEALPEVWLRGNLKVAGIPEANEEAPPFTNDEQPDDKVEAADIPKETKPERKELVNQTEPAHTIKVRPRRLREMKKPVSVSDQSAASVLPQTDYTHGNPQKLTAVTTKSAPHTASVAPIRPLVRPIQSTHAQKQGFGDIHPKKLEKKPTTLPKTPVSITKAPLGAPPSTIPAPAVASFTPGLVQNKKTRAQKAQSTQHGWLLPIAISSVALMIAGALLMIKVDLVVANGQLTPHFFVSTEQLKAAVSLIR